MMFESKHLRHVPQTIVKTKSNEKKKTHKKQKANPKLFFFFIICEQTQQNPQKRLLLLLSSTGGSKGWTPEDGRTAGNSQYCFALVDVTHIPHMLATTLPPQSGKLFSFVSANIMFPAGSHMASFTARCCLC